VDKTFPAPSDGSSSLDQLIFAFTAQKMFAEQMVMVLEQAKANEELIKHQREELELLQERERRRLENLL
jgi:hypothetical protein